jgi:hypothetical protein
MTIEQTIDVPASRRLTLDVPPEIPVGKVILTFTPAPDDSSSEASVERESPPEDETEFLLRSPVNRERLLQAAANVEKGRSLIFFDTLDDAVKAAEKAKDELSP